MSGEKILMTGGTGYLGSRLLPMLLSNNFQVTLLKRSFSNCTRNKEIMSKIATINLDETSVEQIFQDKNFDIILHCATNYGRKVSDPLQIIEANLVLPLRLIEMGAQNKLHCFINTDTIIDKRISQYSLSKHQFNEWLMLYANRINCVNIALEHFYGPGDDDTKFVSNIIKKMINGEPSIDLTLGEQKRDFIYISDVVSAFEAVIRDSLKKENGYNSFEVGTGHVVSIKYFVEQIAQITQNETTRLNFGALPYRENEVMESSVDLTALKRLGWECLVPLREGLEKTIAFEHEHIGRLAK
jgi:nucleoside-diphosphate-sugar epimerase